MHLGSRDRRSVAPIAADTDVLAFLEAVLGPA